MIQPIRLAAARRAIAALAGVGICLTAAGCATTRLDRSSATTAVPTTTTLPDGGATELLPLLVGEASQLSNVIGANGDRSEQMTRIQNVYDAVRPDIDQTNGLLADSFDAAITLCQRATQFKRPADADKCFRNLEALSDQYLTAIG
ncbi:MAG TPA: hypothetical protein PLV68_05800 [Ilumatobacteraceae bacterium]|nr:hypothetical protein [Ilumatobacteraceae bacterium]